MDVRITWKGAGAGAAVAPTSAPHPGDAGASGASASGGMLQRRYGETAVIKENPSYKGRTIIIHPTGARPVLGAAARRYGGDQYGATFRQPVEVGVRSGRGNGNTLSDVAIAGPSEDVLPASTTSPSRLPRPRHRGANIPSMLVPASVFDPDPPRVEPTAAAKEMHGLVNIL